jgi:trans-aconitate methyltransferase
VSPTTDQSTGERQHWERVHAGAEPHELSWFQSEPSTSLELLDALGVGPDASLVDVGGGSSRLVDRLLDRGFADLTVLDVSEAALAAAQARLGARADAIAWLLADVREWRPERRYDVWHDRALLHFFVDLPDRERYAETLRGAVAPGGAVVIATFAPDGPETCSGLPVRRHDAGAIATLLGPGAELVAERRDEHVTPRGRVQPFTCAAFRLHA